MAMKMQENYIEGIIRVPLTQFVAEESRNHPPNCITVCGFEGVLQNPRHQITGYISYQLQNKLLNDLKLSPKEFKKTIGSAAIPTIADQDIHCLVNGSALEAAQQLHKSGGLAECTVQICYLPPPQSKKFSDGEIFQNVRHFVKQERYHIAQQWVNIVSGPKRRHLTFLFDRPLIMHALDRLLCLPGLWAGLQLGNWAKHLAAHVDELIINYLAHISDSYEKIFRGHEDLKHLLDESTVKQIQNRAPRWSSNDRHYIEEAFRQKIIFTDITSRDVLAKLEQNLLSFETIIPSIQTFHQNMKYITIGIKILEKHIAIQPAATKKGDITRTRPSLIDSLKNDWVGSTTTGHFQVDHEKFIPATEANADTSIAQLLLAALRYFPLLCREAPLQDVDCEWKAPEPSDYSTLIRRTALQLGFDNPKIRKDVGNATMNYPLYEKPFARRRWRSGKLPCHSFALLFDQSFFLQLFGQPFEQSTVVTPLRTQSAILRAFFNLWDYYAISAAPGIDMAEAGMDVEESPWAETQWAEILSSRSLEKPTRFKRKRTKPLQNDQRAGEHWEVPPKNTQEMQMVPWVPSVQAAPVPQRQLTIFEEALPTPNKPLMRAINDYDDEDAEPAINNRRKRADIRPTKKFKGNSTASTIPLLHEGTEPPATTDAPAGIKLHEGTEPPATTDAPAGTELHEDTEPDEMVVDRDIIPEQTATVNKQGAQALDSDDEFGGIR
ncbi:hypothetical protein M441DRAFT_133351 [Trichoderma asperellum CBS 433.97]|uniref:Uncharacterized protein n=1 Tax=Trichoderma asperellum (strain ATCC 204424 / CBS 433.97 / NBRC 101777) TaxID=1042311 RepID=A0A2T3ZG99_TRIA4|nr:hypothetical protein M441DRAFT_133351 [Trichoderma asperellum CBS 433.97]PTB43826.1 hypothetical protein M441DRAFT_133351 [Trichoderma asperellum CBS 433.97]